MSAERRPPATGTAHETPAKKSYASLPRSSDNQTVDTVVDPDFADPLASALWLAGHGFHVFPLDHPALPNCIGLHGPTSPCDGKRGKHPAVKFSMASTTDPKMIASWFAGSTRNIGVACKPGRLVVLDEDARDELQRWSRDHAVTIPTTYTVNTSRGLHYYFTGPDDLEIGNGEKPFDGYDINVRGYAGDGGGYVVAPGSRHGTGHLYAPNDPDAPIAELPELLATALASKKPVQKPPTNKSKDDEVQSPPAASEDPNTAKIGYKHRHQALVSYAGRLRKAGLDRVEAESLFFARWLLCVQPPGQITEAKYHEQPPADCDYPVTWDEAKAKLDSVYDLYPAGSPQGDDRDDGHPEQQLLPPPTDPMAVARAILLDYQVEGCLTLRQWRGSWMRWQRSRWVEIEDAELRSAVYQRLEDATYIDDSTKTPTIKEWQPTRYKVANVLDASHAVAHLSADVDAPTWLNRDEPRSGDCMYRATEIVACTNGLLHVGTRELLDLTPTFFNTVAVPFDYDPDAAEPKRWIAFLAELWPEDPDSIAALQEVFGYVLSGRTDLHKILLIVGPTRSGKGTIARVLTALVGRGNAAGPTLASLGTNFGLSPLLGKPLAVVSDARLDRTNVSMVVERLLSVSGEDMLTVDRKYREPWTGKLPTRFVLLSNELPRFGDASGAIAARFIVLMMEKSFLGRENTRLTDELLAELPGILRWSLDGLDRVASRSFTTPPSSADAVTALQDLVSPVAAFVRDICETGVGRTVECNDLYDAWKVWCDDNGHKKTSVQTFGRDLRAVLPQVRVKRPHGGKRHYLGVSPANNGADRGSSRFTGSSEPLNRDEPRHNPLLAGVGAEPADDEQTAIHLLTDRLGATVLGVTEEAS